MKYLLLFLILFSMILLYSQSINMNYSIIDELYENENFSIVCIIEKGIEGFGDIYLILSDENNINEKKYKMGIEDNTASVIVKYEDLPKTNFYYYFEIEKKDGTIEYYPKTLSERIKNKVILLKKTKEQEINAVLLSPLNPDNAKRRNFLVSVYINKKLDNRQVLFDNMDITDYCLFSDNIIIYQPDTISVGEHTIDIYTNGYLVESYRIIIKDKEIKKTLNGEVEYNFTYNYVNNNVLNNTIYENDFYNNLHLKLFNTNSLFNYLVLLNIHNLENDMYNQYYIDLYAKYIGLKFADFILNWDKIFYNNKNIRGIDLYSQIKNFYFDLVYGYIIRNNDYADNIKAIRIKHTYNIVNNSLNAALIDSSQSESYLLGTTNSLNLFNRKLNINFDMNYNYYNDSINNIKDQMKYSVYSNIYIKNFYFNIFYNSSFNNPYNIQSNYNDYQYNKMGIKTRIPLFNNNLYLNLMYLFTDNTYNNVNIINHTYSINLNYFNIDMPGFNMLFQHSIDLLSPDFINNNINFTTNIDFESYIFDFKNEYSIFYNQNVFSSYDSLYNYVLTNTGVNYSILPISIIKLDLMVSYSHLNNYYNQYSYFSIYSKLKFIPFNEYINPTLFTNYYNKENYSIIKNGILLPIKYKSYSVNLKTDFSLFLGNMHCRVLSLYCSIKKQF